jgi:hypothetical protein
MKLPVFVLLLAMYCNFAGAQGSLIALCSDGHCAFLPGWANCRAWEANDPPRPTSFGTCFDVARTATNSGPAVEVEVVLTTDKKYRFQTTKGEPYPNKEKPWYVDEQYYNRVKGTKFIVYQYFR